MNTILWWIVEGLKLSMPVVLACIGLQIAARQWYSSHHGVKLNLFDRRFEVYIATRQFISLVTKDLNIPIDDVRVFYRATEKAVFLFDKSVTDFLVELPKKALALRTIQQHMSKAISLEDSKTIEGLNADEMVLVHWMIDADNNLADKFRPSLDFSKI